MIPPPKNTGRRTPDLRAKVPADLKLPGPARPVTWAVSFNLSLNLDGTEMEGI